MSWMDLHKAAWSPIAVDWSNGKPSYSTIQFINTPFLPNTVTNKDAVNTIIRREIFPACIEDTPGAQENFYNWSISPFTPSLGGFEAIVTAIRNYDQIHIFKKVVVAQGVLLAFQGLDQMFNTLDTMISDAVDWITTWQEPHNTATCTDPECFC